MSMFILALLRYGGFLRIYTGAQLLLVVEFPADSGKLLPLSVQGGPFSDFV